MSRAEASSRSSDPERAELFRHRREAGIFHRQFAELALSANDGRVCQRAADFFIAVDHFFEPQANGVFHANHCKGRRSSYSALHATKHTRIHGHFTGPRGAGRVVADRRSALSTTNSDNADLVLADMALSRGDCRGGTDRYLKAALATNDAHDFRAREQGRLGVPADRRERQDRAALAEARTRQRRRGRGGGARGGAALSTRRSERGHPAHAGARR